MLAAVAVVCAISPDRVAGAAETVLMDEAGLRLVSEDRGRERYCRLTLAPQAGGRSGGPRIVLKSVAPRSGNRLTTRLRLEIESLPGARQTVAVIGDRRLPVTDVVVVDLAGRDKPALFAAIAAKSEIHITSRLADGRLHSARFEGRDLSKAFGTLYSQCKVATLGLDGMDDILAANESRLRVPPRELRRMTLLLHGRYARKLEPPRFTGKLASLTRELLERFSRDVGLPASRYLHRELLRKLREANYTPGRWRHRRYDNYASSKDWYVYTEGNGRNRRCFLESEARRVRGARIWRYPHMRFSVRANEDKGRMYLDLLTPNILITKRRSATATVDGASYFLAVRSGALLPVRRSGEFAADFVRAVRRGRQIVVAGLELGTREKLRLDFSANGFTAGFKAMMRLCRRPDLTLAPLAIVPPIRPPCANGPLPS